MTTPTTPKSRKATLSALNPVITELNASIKVDCWGDISFTTKTCRCLIFTRGSRRSPSTIQVYSTFKCPEGKRLTEPFRLAKKVAATLNFPVCFSAAGRSISATINPH